MRYVLMIVLLLNGACQYNKFEPMRVDSLAAWQATTTIDLLRPGQIDQFGDVVVAAMVVANDSAANFYRQIVVTDPQQSASLAINIGLYDSYVLLPMGRRVKVKLDGMILKKVDGLLTAGYRPIDELAPPAPIATYSLLNKHVRVDDGFGELLVEVMTFDELKITHCGKTFRFVDVYMDPAFGIFSGERTLGQVGVESAATLYTSPYAAFAQQSVPSTLFDIEAIVVSYQGKVQLKIVSTEQIFPTKL